MEALETDIDNLPMDMEAQSSVINTTTSDVVLENCDDLFDQLRIAKASAINENIVESTKAMSSTASTSSNDSEPLFTAVQVQVQKPQKRVDKELDHADRPLQGSLVCAGDKKMDITLCKEIVEPSPSSSSKYPHPRKAPRKSSRFSKVELTPVGEEPNYEFVQEILKKLESEFQEEKAKDNETNWKTNLETILSNTDAYNKMEATKPVRATIPRPERLPLESSDKAPHLIATIRNLRNAESMGVEKVNIVTINPVHPLPSSTYWTYIPYNVRLEDDAKELSHYPNLDNIKIKPANKAKFEEELFRAYGNKFHGDVSESGKIEDELFMKLVKSVENDDRLRLSGPTSTETNVAKELWTALSKSIDGGGTETELKTRYDDIKSRENPPEASHSVDRPSATLENQSRDVTMKAFTALFCRKCFTYDCFKHTDTDHLDAKSYLERKTSTSNSTNSSSPLRGMNKETYDEDDAVPCVNSENCWRKSETVERGKEEIMAQWNPNERAMFRCLWESFEKKYCLISNTLMTKSCKQVRELATLLKAEQDEVNNICPAVSLTPIKTKDHFNKNKESEAIKKLHGSFFIPCKHTINIPCNKRNPDCVCGKTGTGCEKYCFCPDDCPLRFTGCKCDGEDPCGFNKECPCFKCNRECDPELCMSCGANEHVQHSRTRECRNVSLQRGYQIETLKVRESRVHQGGWGLFAFSEIKKGDFMVEYRGELISHDEGERRGMVYDLRMHTFMFYLNERYILDSTRYGNKSRFINSSKTPNALAKHMIVNGDTRIGIYAIEDVPVGEEILMDYHHVLKKKQLQESKPTASIAQTQ